jgi:LemA protein
VNFSVDDLTGSVLVKANSNRPELYPTSLPTKYYGNYRESESVIKADAKVLVLGEYNLQQGTIGGSSGPPGIQFTISTHGEKAILTARGWTSVSTMALAVFSFVLAIGFMLNLLRVHHIMVSSIVVFLTLPPILFLQWTLVTAEQFTIANGRVEQYRRLVENQDPANDTKTQLRHALIKRDAVRVHQLYQQYRNRYTNIAHAALMGLDDLQMQKLDATQREILKPYPVPPRITTVLNTGIVGALGLSGLVAMALLGFIGYRKMGTKRMIENIPTSKVKGIVPGMTEIVGHIQPHNTVISARYSGDAVVYCRYLMKRLQKSGKKSRWVVVESGVQLNVFNVRDDTGEIPVNAVGAKVDAMRTHYSRSGHLKYYEWTLRPDQEIYVLGPAVLDNPFDQNLTIEASREERHFVISDQGETSIMLKYARVGMLILGAALSCCIVSVMTIYGGASFDAFGYFAGALVAVLFLIILNIAFIFNDLIFVKNWQQRGKSNLDVSLKRRADLIPNLVRVVSEALQHEKDLQVTLAELRGGGGQQPVGAMHQRFMALLEQYPNLSGNDVIVDLNNRIVAVENQLQYSRTGYNAATQQFNSRVKQIPEVFLAQLMRLTKKPYFQLQHANEGKAVDVGRLLKTSDEKQSEQVQREEEARLELVSDGEIITATLVCLMAVDGNIGKQEYQHMLQIVSTSQPHLDMSSLRTLAQSVLDKIKNEGLNSVLNTTISLVQRLAGTEIGRDLIQAMNVIAESEEGVEAAEQGLIDRFKDVLGGQ